MASTINQTANSVWQHKSTDRAIKRVWDRDSVRLIDIVRLSVSDLFLTGSTVVSEMKDREQQGPPRLKIAWMSDNFLAGEATIGRHISL